LPGGKNVFFEFLALNKEIEPFPIPGDRVPRDRLESKIQVPGRESKIDIICFPVIVFIFKISSFLE